MLSKDCDPDSLNSLSAVQRYSHLKFWIEPNLSNQPEKAKLRAGKLWMSINLWRRLWSTTSVTPRLQVIISCWKTSVAPICTNCEPCWNVTWFINIHDKCNHCNLCFLHCTQLTGASMKERGPYHTATNSQKITDVCREHYWTLCKHCTYVRLAPHVLSISLQLFKFICPRWCTQNKNFCWNQFLENKS